MLFGGLMVALNSYGAVLDSGASVNGPGSLFSGQNMIGAMLDSQTSIARYQIEWSGIERSIGVYDWSTVDDYVTTCQAKGFFPTFILQNAPTWRTEALSIDNSKNVPTAADSATFATLVMQRYGSAFYAFEIANEGFNTGLLTAQNAPTMFAQMLGLLQAVQPIIKQYSPNTKIGAPAELNKTIANVSAWTTGFYTAGCNALVDFVNLHYYNGNNGPNNPLAGQDGLVQWIQAWQSAGTKPLRITETGWTLLKNNNGGVPDSTLAGFLTTELTDVFNSQFVEAIYYYNLGQLAPGSNQNQDFTKQSYNAWKSWIAQHPNLPGSVGTSHPYIPGATQQGDAYQGRPLYAAGDRPIYNMGAMYRRAPKRGGLLESIGADIARLQGWIEDHL